MEAKYEKARNLEARASKFGLNVIALCQSFGQAPINSSVVNQLIRAATSVGANYMEANGASSKKDFKNKIFICKKEAQEVKNWLKMLLQTNPTEKSKIFILGQEVNELSLIFGKICGTLNSK